MCFSASISFAAAAVLVPTGLYAVNVARRLTQPYWFMAMAPIFFGIQQAFEGRVWQLMDAGEPVSAVPFAIGFHFFSHFLWLWWIPLASGLIEASVVRRRLFLAIAAFGFLAGGMVYSGLLLHPEWLSVQVEGHSLVYDISSPLRGPVDIPLPASALYGLIILVPLLASSHRHMRTFGWLVLSSIVLTSAAWGYAFVSVWCFFAAALSLYFVFMIRQRRALRARGLETTG